MCVSIRNQTPLNTFLFYGKWKRLNNKSRINYSMKTVFNPETQKKIDYILPSSTYLEKYLLLEKINKELNKTYDSSSKEIVNSSGILTGTFMLSGIFSSIGSYTFNTHFNFLIAVPILGTCAMGSLFVKEYNLYSNDKLKHEAKDLIQNYLNESKLDLEKVDKVYNSPYQDIVLLMAAMRSPEARKIRYVNFVRDKIYCDISRRMGEDSDCVHN